MSYEELPAVSGLELSMRVPYAGEFDCLAPQCAQLVALATSNSLLDTARRALADLQPRKRFETDLCITVGSVRSMKGGQYYRGPQHFPEGVARRDELLAKGTLATYSGWHYSKAVAVFTGFHLPLLHATHRVCEAHAEVSVESDGAEPWLGEFSDAMFEVFVAALSVAEPAWGRCSWTYRGFAHAYEKSITTEGEGVRLRVPGYRTMIYLPPDAVATLGGIDRIKRESPAIDIRAVALGGGSEGAAARLCRHPRDLSPRLLEEWRTFLLPVVDLPNPNPAIRRWSSRNRPLDVLPRDSLGQVMRAVDTSK